MMSNQERLVYMINQIARNFATMGEGRAAAATADHIVSFWDPRMRSQILAQYERNNADLTPIAAKAIARLREHDKPSAQTPATAFNAVNEAGHSDAG